MQASTLKEYIAWQLKNRPARPRQHFQPQVRSFLSFVLSKVSKREASASTYGVSLNLVTGDRNLTEVTGVLTQRSLSLSPSSCSLFRNVKVALMKGKDDLAGQLASLEPRLVSCAFGALLVKREALQAEKRSF